MFNRLTIICFIFAIFIISILFFYLLSTKPKNSTVDNHIKPTKSYLIQVPISFDMNKANLFTIGNISEVPTNNPPTVEKELRLNQIFSEYQIDAVDKMDKVIFTKKFNVATEISDDGFIFGEKSPSIRSINLEKQDLLLTLPPLGNVKYFQIKNVNNGHVLAKKGIDKGLKSYGQNPQQSFANISGAAGSNTLNIAVLSSGFTQSEMSSFELEANQAKNAFMNFSPLNEFGNLVNFNLVKTTDDMECKVDGRCAFCNVSKVNAAANKAGVAHDGTLVIMNTDQYGGCAIGEEVRQAVVTRNESNYAVMIHELGHSLFSLHDEYSYVGEESQGPITGRTDRNCLQGPPPSFEWGTLVSSYRTGCSNHSNWTSPSERSMMYDLSPFFNEVSKKLIRERFGVYTNNAAPPLPSDGASKEEEVTCQDGLIKVSFFYKPSTDPAAVSHEIRYYIQTNLKFETQKLIGKDGMAQALDFTKNIDIPWDIYACSASGACSPSKNGPYQFNTGDPCKNPTPTPTQKISPTLKPSPTITPTVTPELDSFTDVCKGKGTLVDYLEARCGGLKYNQDDAISGKFFGKVYSDVYLCTGGESEIRYPDLKTCSEPPWNLKSPTGTPTNTPTPSPTVQAMLTPKIGTTNTPTPKVGATNTPTPSPTPIPTNTPTPPQGGTPSVCGTCSKLGTYYSGPTKYYYHEWGNNQCCAGAPNSCVNSSIANCPN